MTDVIVIGGGPAGLSAALFTAKNGLDTTVFDTDDTWLHMAHLFNYLGIESIDGSEFMEVAREQVDGFGVDRRQGEEVTAVARDGDGFAVTTEDGEYEADYVVIAAGGDGRELAEDLGCEVGEEKVVKVDEDNETTVEDAYAAGSTVREDKYQAIISAGSGAAAAIDVLSKEEGSDFHDFDTPEDA